MIIAVEERPLPRAIIHSTEYGRLSDSARQTLLDHLRYIQHVPMKIDAWRNAWAPATELENLIAWLNLDLSVYLGVPQQADDIVSPWLLHVQWVSHSKALSSFLKPQHIVALNGSIPQIGASLNDIESWLTTCSILISELLAEFFDSGSYDHAVAYLISLQVFLSGVQFGLGRIQLQYPVSAKC